MVDQSKTAAQNPSPRNPMPAGSPPNPAPGESRDGPASRNPTSPAVSPPNSAPSGSNESRDGPASISAGVANARTAKDEEGSGGVMVTYRPGPQDPVSTMWNGHTFEANKPVRVKHTGMLAQAKTNPFFEVEGHSDAKKPDPKVNNDVPVDSEGYRKHAVEWFKAARNAAQMKARWDAEESLRQACGVGSDDLVYLDKLYGPRYAELLKAES